MTAFLTWFIGRLPIGWLQLTHNRGRLTAALAGVAFANVLIFMQLGFLGALFTAIMKPYLLMNAEIMLSAPDGNTMSDGSNIARQFLYQVAADGNVADATPLFIGRFPWELDNGDSVILEVYGVDPEKSVVLLPEIEAAREKLKLPDTILVDVKSRGLDKATRARIEGGERVAFEYNGRTLTVAGGFTLGGGFESDGYAVVSDQTFLRMFPKRSSGAPNHVLVRAAPGVDPKTLASQLARTLPADQVQVRTSVDAANHDRAYQTTKRPIGVVFGFGVLIGILVGIVIVYQVLSADVADHLGEYATLKAIGYRQRFFLGIVFEEAAILALLGFIPGMVLSLILYKLAAAGTGLPIAMDPLRAVIVLTGTLFMCTLSGALATRRLAGADPADLF